MQESKLFGYLLMMLPELRTVAENLREKYGIPPVSPGEDGITKLILADKEIDWDTIGIEIDAQIRNNSDMLPPEYRSYLALRNQVSLPDEPDIYEKVSDDFRAKVTALYKFYVATMKAQLPMVLTALDQYYDTLTRIVKEFLVTGKGTPVPDDWFGKVATQVSPDGSVVFAMANELTDHRRIVAEFKAELTETFGKQKRRIISEEDLEAAAYLPLHMTGKTFKEIVKLDMKLHPELRSKKRSRYEATEITRKGTIRKRFQRLKAFLRELEGDRKS